MKFCVNLNNLRRCVPSNGVVSSVLSVVRSMGRTACGHQSPLGGKKRRATRRWKLRVRNLALRSHSHGNDSNNNNNKQQQQQQKELKEVVFQIPKNKVAAKPLNGTRAIG